MSYSTPITKNLVKSFFEDFAKVLVDKKLDQSAPTGDLELIIEQPYIMEPRELRNNDEFTVKGTQLLNPNDVRRRKSKAKHWILPYDPFYNNLKNKLTNYLNLFTGACSTFGV